MSAKSALRRLAARLVHPLLGALDVRLEQLAARLERHTTNLSLDQRAEIARIDERLTLDVAVVSEHLVGIERVARAATTAADRVVVALPGDPLRLPAGAAASSITAYAPDHDGTWRRVAATDDATLRLVQLRSVPGA